MSLARLGGRWWIVGKIFHRTVPPNAPPPDPAAVAARPRGHPVGPPDALLRAGLERRSAGGEPLEPAHHDLHRARRSPRRSLGPGVGGAPGGPPNGRREKPRRPPGASRWWTRKGTPPWRGSSTSSPVCAGSTTLLFSRWRESGRSSASSISRRERRSERGAPGDAARLPADLRRVRRGARARRPLRAGGRAGGRGIPPERVGADRPLGQGHADRGQVRDGAGRANVSARHPRRGARGRRRHGRARPGHARSGFPGHGDLREPQHPDDLDADAHRRRGGARDARRGGRREVGRGRDRLPGREGPRHPWRVRPQPRLRRARGGGRPASGSRIAGPQAAVRLASDRKGPPAHRCAADRGRRAALRVGRPAPRHESRERRPLSGRRGQGEDVERREGPRHPGRAPRRAGRGRARRRRRRHRGGAGGARSARADDRMGRRAQREGRHGRGPGGSPCGPREARRRTETRGRRGDRARGGLPQARGRVLLSLPGPRSFGADERGGRCPRRSVRDLGRVAGAQPRAVRGREAARPPGICGHRQRDVARGRFRSARPRRLRARRRGGLARREGPGSHPLDALGRPA